MVFFFQSQNNRELRSVCCSNFFGVTSSFPFSLWLLCLSSAWLWDQTSYDGFIPTLSKRIEMITGLSTQYRELFSSAEPFQVVNYGMGGQYEPHVDFYEVRLSLDNFL